LLALLLAGGAGRAGWIKALERKEVLCDGIMFQGTAKAKL
jgi:hypothetical protein